MLNTKTIQLVSDPCFISVVNWAPLGNSTLGSYGSPFKICSVNGKKTLIASRYKDTVETGDIVLIFSKGFRISTEFLEEFKLLKKGYGITKHNRVDEGFFTYSGLVGTFPETGIKGITAFAIPLKYLYTMKQSLDLDLKKKILDFEAPINYFKNIKLVKNCYELRNTQQPSAFELKNRRYKCLSGKESVVKFSRL